ncbi:MAG: hypothetical protein FWH22_07750, partial [Fibromonadales bacterium]|nr:hypothetical protein [Fibromonadales bacterium]
PICSPNANCQNQNYQPAAVQSLRLVWPKFLEFTEYTQNSILLNSLIPARFKKPIYKCFTKCAGILIQKILVQTISNELCKSGKSDTPIRSAFRWRTAAGWSIGVQTFRQQISPLTGDINNGN